MRTKAFNENKARRIHMIESVDKKIKGVNAVIFHIRR